MAVRSGDPEENSLYTWSRSTTTTFRLRLLSVISGQSLRLSHQKIPCDDQVVHIFQGVQVLIFNGGVVQGLRHLEILSRTQHILAELTSPEPEAKVRTV